MTRQQVAPCAVAQLGRAARRVHDVGEEHGREHAGRFRHRDVAREEALHRVEDLVTVDEVGVVAPLELDVLGVRNRVGEHPREPDGEDLVAPVEDEHRRP